MCVTPEYVDSSLGSFVFRVTVRLSYVCDTPEYVDSSLGSFVYRVTVRLSYVCDTPEYVDSSLGSFVFRVTVRLSYVCDTPEYVDRRQALVHLYIESQPGCRMCVTHLNTWIEGKPWFICI